MRIDLKAKLEKISADYINLESLVIQYRVNATMLKVIQQSWLDNMLEIEDYKHKLNQSKSQMILGNGDQSIFEDDILHFYALLQGAIKKLSQDQEQKNNNLFSLFQETQILKLSEREITEITNFIEKQINYLAETIQSVKNPSLLLRFKTWLNPEDKNDSHQHKFEC